MNVTAGLEQIVDLDAPLEEGADWHEGSSSTSLWGWCFLLGCLAVWSVGLVKGFTWSLAALSAVGLLAAVVGILHPTIGLLGIGLLCTMDTASKHFLMTGGLLRWHTLDYWLVLASIPFAPLLLRLNDLPTRLLQMLLFLLAIGLVWSPNIAGGVSHLLYVVGAPALLAYFLRTERDASTWIWLGLVNGAAGAAGGLVYFLQRADLPEVNPNAMTYFPVTALASICLAMPYTTRARHARWALLILAVVNFNWVFLIGSRGGLMIATICVLFLVTQLRNTVHRVIVVGAFVLMSLLILVRFEELRDHTLGRVEVLVDDERSVAVRTSGRSALFATGWRMFCSQPWGVGTGGFAVIWGEYQSPGASGARYKTAHAAWLQTLAENGLPGFLALAAYVGSFAYLGWRSQDRTLLSFGLFATVLLGAAFIPSDFQPKLYWFFTAGVTAMFIRAAEDEETEEQFASLVIMERS